MTKSDIFTSLKKRGSCLPREYLIQDNGVLTALRSFSDSAIISFA